MPGGILSDLSGALVIAFSYGWVAWRTGSIRWTVALYLFMNCLGVRQRCILPGNTKDFA
jgi:membrane protease YdiL (CAAX protease family)